MKQKTFLILCSLIIATAMLSACHDKDNNDPDTPPAPDYSETPYFIVNTDTVSIYTGDSVIDGHCAATCRIVDDTVFYYLMVAKEITGTGVRRPAATINLRYDDLNHWQLTQAAMYEDFDHAVALTEENGGVATFDWLNARTLRSNVDGYDRESNTLSFVVEIDMFNLYELYFGGDNRTIDNVSHKIVTISTNNVTFAPLGF